MCHIVSAGLNISVCQMLAEADDKIESARIMRKKKKEIRDNKVLLIIVDGEKTTDFADDSGF